MNPSRRKFLGAGAQLAAATALGMFTSARAARAAPIEARTLAPGITLLTGAGGNVVAVQGQEGSLLVDGGLASRSRELLRAASRATGSRKVHTLINTHWHPAQTGSNEAVGKRGATIVAHEVTRLYLARAVASVDYEGLHGPLPEAGRPTQATRTDGSLSFAGRQVDYGYLPAAHTNGDLYVHFPEANLLVGGGPVCAEGWPLLDWRNGAWLGGLVRAHERLAGLVKPDTVVVPADGCVFTGEELHRHHQMYAAFHERMVGYLNKGMDSGDCIADRPLKDFEPAFGDPADFITGAFRSLNLAYAPD